jgi:fibronectin-binding autotransporter adhesin
MKTKIQNLFIAIVLFVAATINAQPNTPDIVFSGYWYNNVGPFYTTNGAGAWYNATGQPTGNPVRRFPDPYDNTKTWVDWGGIDREYIGGVYDLGYATRGFYYFNGSLTISGGAVLADSGAQIGDWGGWNTNPDGPTNNGWAYIGTGEVTVDGAGSTWQNNLLVGTNYYEGGIQVGGGWLGSSGYLTIQNGGTVNSYGNCVIGGATCANCYGGLTDHSGSYGSVIVNGSGSLWTISPLFDPGYSVSTLTIGDGQSGGPGGWGQLLIENGGKVVVYPSGSANFSVYSSALGSSSFIVDGIGSSFTMTNSNISIGFRFGVGNPYYTTTLASTMIIRNGGFVFDSGASAQKASILVDGAGSTWSNVFLNVYGIASGGVSLADGGPSSNLTIQNGGLVYVGSQMQLSSGSQLTVSGIGSILINDTGNVATETGGNSVVVTNGGTIRCNGTAAGNGGVSLDWGDALLITGTNSSIVCSNSCGLNGTVTLLNGGTLTASGNINVSGNGSSIAPGILGGNGVVNGNLWVSGATLVPNDGAGGIGTLTINGNLHWNNGGSANFTIGTNCDQIVVSGNLQITGILNISTAPGVAAGSYTLFAYGGSLTLDTVNITGPAGFSYSINTNTPGEVNLVLTSNPPSFTGAKINGGNLLINGASGFPYTNFYIISSTNLTLPLSQWPIVATNQFDGAGNFTFSNVVVTNASQQYYSIKMP